MTNEPGVEEGTEERVSIRLVDFPIALSTRAGRHYEALQREFALIHFSDEATRASVPARLLEVADRARQALASGEVISREQFAASMERGDRAIPVDLRMPRSASTAMADLLTLLVEADDFCRKGDLITIAMPDDCRAFREWFLHEFVRQINGEAPTPWRGPFE